MRGNYAPVGYEQVTSLSAATGLTVPGGAKMAIIVPESQAVRWKDLGTDPTASVGMPLAAGDYLEYEGDLDNITFIEQASGAKLNVSYYG